MIGNRFLNALLILASVLTLTACGGGGPLFGRSRDVPDQAAPAANDVSGREIIQNDDSSIWDILRNRDTGTTVEVNKYLWNASLEVLDFLPVQTVDPFSGVIVTGYGTPPGGGRSYRATVYVKDPALDARSLNVSLQGPGGRPVAKGTVRAIEDAILARARQLRIADGKI